MKLIKMKKKIAGVAYFMEMAAVITLLAGVYLGVQAALAPVVAQTAETLANYSKLSRDAF